MAEVGALVETEMLDAVQAAVGAAIAAAPWPHALTALAAEVLTEPGRILSGRLTPWTLMPLCCCAAACGEWRRAVPAAAAVELYVNALELLDDLADGDGCLTIHRYGAAVTLNLTTALLALAHLTLHAAGTEHGAAARRAQDALWMGLAVAVGGQHLDLTTAGGAPLSVEECLDLARRKSGGPSEACCRAGAAFGTADAALIDRFGALGQSLGLVGQLDNDLHGASDGSPKSDRARQAQTVPVAFARALGAGRDGEALALDGGLQMAYALLHAERVRAHDAVDDVAAACPEPDPARVMLHLLMKPRGLAAAANATI